MTISLEIGATRAEKALLTASLNQEEIAADLAPVPILLIYSGMETWSRGAAQDNAAYAETIQTACALKDALSAAGHAVALVPVGRLEDVAAAVAAVDPATTLVFNLVEQLGAVSGEEAQVPRLLDRLGFEYVGATAENLDACLDKGQAKADWLSQGISTAPFQVFHRPDEAITVPLPALVKPVAEDCSIGITLDSVVSDASTLRKQVACIIETYRQPALVEQFLDGREFNVSIWGNGTAQVLPLAEIDYSAVGEQVPHILHFAAKWDENSPDYLGTPSVCPAQVEPELADRIRRLALAAFHTMGCRDFARVDIRVKDDTPYVLEVNPNPCLAPSGGFANAARVAGFDYAHMAHQIAGWAWRRRDRDEG